MNWEPHKGLDLMIFAVSEDPDVVERFEAWATRVDLPFKRVSGVYNGKAEVSYVTPRYLSGLHAAGLMEWLRQQESILSLSAVIDGAGRRKATLVYRYDLDREDVDLGLWRSSSRSEALGRDSYTYDPLTNTYFVTDPAPEQRIAAE